MKKLIIALGIVGLMGAALELAYNTDVEVINQTETIIEVQTVDSLEDRIKTAQEAKMSEIEASAQAAYNELMAKELKRIEDKVKAEYIEEIEATITSVDY